MFKGIMFAVLLVVSTPYLHAEQKKRPDPFVLFTLPKSGTYLVVKCINMLTGSNPNSVIKKGNAADIRKQILRMRKEGKYPTTHFHVPRYKYFNQCVQKYKDIKKVITVRDLRDVAVSGMQYFIKEGNGISDFAKMAKTAPYKLQKMSTDDQLTMIIRHMLNIGDSLDKMLRYYMDPTVFVIRYEDLIGDKGAGSDERMRLLLIELAKYLNVPLSEEKLERIQNNLYGNKAGTYQSHTFRKGQIGRWKDYFKKQHEDEFNKLFGEYAKLFGY